MPHTPPRWIETRPGSPYLVTEDGDSWTPIGQNDAITWPDLAGLFQRRDVPAVERHLRWLKAHGVTCLRVMLEYCQDDNRYLERPAGQFAPDMVRLWDDLFALAEQIGLHVLLTPYDTFFMWRRWRQHPYNRRNGGPVASRSHWLTCPAMRTAIKQRLAFASDRWGGSPALFCWDLWNEARPMHGGNDPASVAPFIDDIAPWLRAHEIDRHGRAHLQTMSVFGPDLIAHPALVEPIFRHPGLDLATTHLYESGTIDNPRTAIAPALAVGRLMRTAVTDAGLRPVFDSEHGPIHSFSRRRRTLPEAFDDACFHNMQWAHFASGGAGGGMRWPYRYPHTLTHGMRRSQAALARVAGTIDWQALRRRNLNAEITVADDRLACFACGDDDRLLVWLLRTDKASATARRRADGEIPARLVIPELAGRFAIAQFDTASGETTAIETQCWPDHRVAIMVRDDVFLTITRCD